MRVERKLRVVDAPDPGEERLTPEAERAPLPTLNSQLPTVFIETYGCQMNISDTELMLGRLAAAGYREAATPDEADVILLNTCAIREHAEQRVLGRLGELRGLMRPGAIVGVTGCMAQRMGPTLLERARHVSLVIGPDGYRALPDLLARARAGERAIETSFDLEEHYEDFTPRRFGVTATWLIMRPSIAELELAFQE